MLADAFRLILEAEQDIDVSSIVSDRAHALEACSVTCPDAVILDLDLRSGDGFEIARLIQDACPCSEIVMVCALPDPDQRRRTGETSHQLFSTDEAAGDLPAIVRSGVGSSQGIDRLDAQANQVSSSQRQGTRAKENVDG